MSMSDSDSSSGVGEYRSFRQITRDRLLHEMLRSAKTGESKSNWKLEGEAHSRDENPPIPDGISADITDFLKQCFKKDARQRPDAKTLLAHPWIQNYRRTLQPSLAYNDTLRIFGSSGSDLPVLHDEPSHYS